MFDDFRSCKRRLLFFDNLMEQIIRKIEMHDSRERTEKSDAQELLKELKDELRKDCMFLSSDTVQDTLTDIDRYIYCPAVQQALSKIRVGSKSKPDMKWVEQLYEAQEEIGHYMELVENYL